MCPGASSISVLVKVNFFAQACRMFEMENGHYHNVYYNEKVFF